MKQWQLFRLLILRPLLQEQLRTVLTAISIALGVSVVIAIDLAGQAAAGSFQSSVETLSGKSALTITAVGGVNEKILGQLAQLPYPFEWTPRIEDFATADSGNGEALPFLGIDLVHNADRGIEDDSLNAAEVRNLIFVGRSLGWHKGDQVKLLINDQVHQCTVAGLLPAVNSGVSENNAIVADIGLAQLLTGKTGRLDSIAVTDPPYDSPEHWEQVLRQRLPASVSLEQAGSRTDQNRKMLAAFRWNLRILSYIALVVGAFLIYNSVAVSVVRRRPAIGILRALGTTRSSILIGFLLESAVLGAVGGVAGLVLGRFLAVAAVGLIGNTVELLYVSSQPAPIQFTLATVLVGLGLGIGMSVLAALAPAFEAARVSPTEAMARGRNEYVLKLHARRHLIGGLALIAIGIFSSLQGPVAGRPLFGYLAAALFIGATALLIPLVVMGGSFLLAQAVRRSLGAPVFLAIRNLRSSLARVSVLVAALATATAMLTSVGIMVGSFRDTVSIWMNNQLRADLYLRPAGSSAADRHPTIAPIVADEIERIPGVAAVDRFRVYPISYQGLPASLGAGQTAAAVTNAATFFLPGEDRSRILRDLPNKDNVIVSEPFANKHHVKPGDVLQLPLGNAVHSFCVLGIYYDYSTERGFIVMDRRTLLKYLPDPASSNLAVYLKNGVDIDTARRSIDRVIRSRGIMMFTNAKLRRAALDIFDRTFQITWALEVIAIVVAIIGIAGALLALVIDRKRDYALLRFLGAERGQIRQIIVAEAGLLGLFANCIGIVLGAGLSLVLIFVINKQSFGWTIQFHWPVALLLIALTGVYLATLAAGLYPARTAVRMNPIEVIHEE